jgi:hypothetical protein
MALLKVNWHPTDKELRSFGNIALIATVLISVLLYAIKGLGLRWTLPIPAVGLIIFVTGRVSIKLTRTIYLGLTMLTLPIGLAISFVLLAALYYLVITPIGLFFRLIRRDPLCRRFDNAAESYWLRRRPTGNIERYFRQF